MNSEQQTKHTLDPEVVTRLQASVRQLGEELSQLVAHGLAPLSDALMVAYGPQRVARLEREAAATDDSTEQVRLAGEAAQASVAVSQAWLRLERRRREAGTERGRAGE